MTALSGDNYHYFVHGDRERIKVRVEIAEELSLEDFKFWRTMINDFLDELEKKKADSR